MSANKTKKHIKDDKELKQEVFPWVQSILILICISAAMFLRYGFELKAVYGIALALIIIPASISDIRSRTVSDYATLSLFILGITTSENITDIIYKTMAAGIIFVPFEMVRKYRNKYAMGGADVKIACGIAFMCGLTRGLSALFIGLLIAVVVTYIRSKNKNENFALVPYIGAAAIIAYLI